MLLYVPIRNWVHGSRRFKRVLQSDDVSTVPLDRAFTMAAIVACLFERPREVKAQSVLIGKARPSDEGKAERALEALSLPAVQAYLESVEFRAHLFKTIYAAMKLPPGSAAVLVPGLMARIASEVEEVFEVMTVVVQQRAAEVGTPLETQEQQMIRIISSHMQIEEFAESLKPMRAFAVEAKVKQVGFSACGAGAN